MIRRFCTACGKPIATEFRFCSFCGATLPEPPPLQREPFPYGAPPAFQAKPPARRRWLGVLAAVAVISCSVWVFISPYLVFETMKQAALSGKADVLEEVVDFPSVRASIKSALETQLEKHTAREMKKDGGLIAAFGGVLAGGLIEVFIDHFVNADMVASLAQGKKVDDAPPELSGLISLFAGKPTGSGGDGAMTITAGYESFDRFTVRIAPRASREAVTLVMLRSGLLKWRLSSIRLPDLDK